MSGGRKLDGPQVVVLAEFGAIPFKLFLSLTGVIRRPGEFLGRGAQTKKSRSRIIPNSGAGRTRRSDAQMLMTMYLLGGSVYLILLQEAVDHSTIIMRAHVF